MMGNMKYKVGDRVRIKDIDWYKKNKNSNGDVVVLHKVPHFSWCEKVRTVFTKDMVKFCGKVVTIESVWSVNYSIVEGTNIDYFTDEMIEGLVEEEIKPKFKVGDKIKLKSTLLNDIFGVIGYESEGYRITNISNGLTYFMSYSIEHYYELVEEETKNNNGMIEGLMEEEIKLKFKVGDKIKLKSTLQNDIFGVIGYEPGGYRITNISNGLTYFMSYPIEHYYELVEEETPKFKVNDIVFVKNIRWVRITNCYWDSLANEYIYEAIGFDGKSEYDHINQSNIYFQKRSESENPHTSGNKITLEEYKNNDKEWLFNKLATLDNITALESIQDIFNYLHRSKYPKTYEECCAELNYLPFTDEIVGYKWDLMQTLQQLLICRDAYWKIAGDEMGIGKPWEPDFTNDEERYGIYTTANKVVKDFCGVGDVNMILTFPTEEMRDAFYENFKEDIEKCKKLL